MFLTLFLATFGASLVFSEDDLYRRTERAYICVDPDHDRKVDIVYARMILLRLKTPEDVISQLLLKLDPDNDGILEYQAYGVDVSNEGIETFCRPLSKEEKVTEFFKFMDLDRLGYATSDMVRSVVGMLINPKFTQEEIEQFVYILDPDHDGKYPYIA